MKQSEDKRTALLNRIFYIAFFTSVLLAISVTYYSVYILENFNRLVPTLDIDGNPLVNTPTYD